MINAPRGKRTGVSKTTKTVVGTEIFCSKQFPPSHRMGKVSSPEKDGQYCRIEKNFCIYTEKTT